jgi:Ca2+-binding RTX toxin-like protein
MKKIRSITTGSPKALLCAALVATTLIALATSGSALAAEQAGQTRVSGKLVVTSVEGAKNDESTLYTLQRSGQPALTLESGADQNDLKVNVRGPARGAAKIEQELSARAGEVVTVTGQLDGATMTVASIAGPTATSSLTGNSVRVGVILVNFADNRAEPWTPANDLVFGNNENSVRAFYDQASFGNFSVSGDVLGWYHLNANAAYCDYHSWSTEAKQLAGTAAQGYDRLMFVFPQNNDCGWNGIADPTEFYVNGVLDNHRTASHELGHTLGLTHSNALDCSDGVLRVTISASACSNLEYGDPFDVMGGKPGDLHRLFNNYDRNLLGFLPPQDITELQGTGPSQIYSSNLLHGLGTPELVRIPRSYDQSKPFYDLEYREAAPWFDDFQPTDPVVNGLSIRMQPSSANVQPLLLDMRPDTETLEDAPLLPGHTFFDPYANYTISMDSLMPSGALYSWLPGAQSTTTVGVSAGAIVVAGSAVADSISISHPEDDFVITSNSGAVTPGAGCAAVQLNQVACPGSLISGVTVNAGGGDDVVYWDGSVSPVVNGDAGNDVLTGGGAADLISGGDGNDILNGGKGADILKGGPGADQLLGQEGDDTLDGGTGSDNLQGSGGIDTIDYSSRTAPVTYHLTGTQNLPSWGEPAAGENDSINEIERVVGGSGNDVLDASWYSSTAWNLVGGAGNDTLIGSDQSDSLVGGSGVDTISGGAGDDSIDAYDGGADTVSCGSGNDVAKADAVALDPLNVDCETPDRTPETFINSGPAKYVKSTSVSFTFSASASGATFKCAMDAGAYSTCASPFATTAAAGAHTFRVKATIGGIQDPTEATRTFSVDTTVPNTTISSTAPVAWDNTPRFAFTASETETRFECSIDSTSVYRRCGMAYTAPVLSDGSHTFRVRAIDRAGNVDATPASQTFTVAAPRSVTVANGVLRYAAPNGQADMFTVSLAGANLQISNSNYSVAAGTGCTSGGVSSAGFTYVNCAASSVTSIYFDTGDGNDYLTADTLGAGRPITVDGGSGTDILSTGAANDRLIGGSGDDLLFPGTGSDTFEGGSGNDQFSGNGAVTYDYMDRSAALNLTVVEDGTIVGGAGNEHDVRTPIPGQQVSIKGGAGDDAIATFSSGAQTVDGGSGNDSITATFGAATLNGGEGDDTLTGTAAGDVLNGGSGDDTMDGNAGADVLNGNAGVDTANYATRSAAQTVTLDGTANDGDSTDGATLTTRDNVKTDVENITGGSGPDSLTGTTGSSSIANLLDGGAGNDTLIGNDGDDSLIGGLGTDTTNGGTGNDTITIRDGATDVPAVCGSGTADKLLADLATVDTGTPNGCELITRW